MGDKGVSTKSSLGPQKDEGQNVISPDGTQRSDQALSATSSNADSPEADDAPTDNNAKPHAPMQKRRRVTRACDECRRKKIKCDGKRPCTHCTVYSYGIPLPIPIFNSYVLTSPRLYI